MGHLGQEPSAHPQEVHSPVWERLHLHATENNSDWASSSPCPIPLHWSLPSSPFFSLAQISPTNDSLGNYKEPQFSAHPQIVTLPNGREKYSSAILDGRYHFFPLRYVKPYFLRAFWVTEILVCVYLFRLLGDPHVC